MNRSDIGPETLQLLLRYEPESGKLFWKKRGPEWLKDGWFTAQGMANQWNAQYAGNLALTSTDSHGYLVGDILGFSFKSHRVAWAVFYGGWPKDQLDHINGNRSDNRIFNLREVTNAENAKNQNRSKKNTSGVTGVSWSKRDKKWRAQIQADGRQRFLGFFVDKSKAVAARKAAELKYGYHKNHGAQA